MERMLGCSPEQFVQQAYAEGEIFEDHNRRLIEELTGKSIEQIIGEDDDSSGGGKPEYEPLGERSIESAPE